MITFEAVLNAYGVARLLTVLKQIDQYFMSCDLRWKLLQHRIHDVTVNSTVAANVLIAEGEGGVRLVAVLVFILKNFTIVGSYG